MVLTISSVHYVCPSHLNGTRSFMIKAFVLCSLLLLVQVSLAQTRSSRKDTLKKVEGQGDTYALIIGISNYASIPDLSYADRDAIAFENFLSSDAGSNVPSKNIFRFVNEQSTRINVTDALSTICSRLKKGDRFYFFFAGHGDMEVRAQKENGLLLLYNSPAGGYFGIVDDVLEITQLRDYLTPLANKGVEVMYIIDACHSGKLSGGKEGARQTAAALLATWGNEHKILSCQPNQYSLEGSNWGGGRGLFSYKLEEGMTGAADDNGDGAISMLELYLYTATAVSKESHYSQIPLVNGDLSSRFAYSSSKSSSTSGGISTGPSANSEATIDSLAALKILSSAQLALYREFDRQVKDRELIHPVGTNAVRSYYALKSQVKEPGAVTMMKRRLVAELQTRFDQIVTPILSGQTSYSTKDECAFAASELANCMDILGQEHYLYQNIKARKLYMDAMSLTWALADYEYNISLLPMVEQSIDSLELSYLLEPNAAYTSMALGERYALVGDLKASEKYFEEYLALRPQSLYAQYSMAQVYLKLQQYKKAEILYKHLSDTLLDASLIWKVSEAQILQGKYKEARENIRRIENIADSAYYFYTAVMFGNMDMSDSSLHYYRLLRPLATGDFLDQVDNNVGHMFFVSRRIDSASASWMSVLNRNQTSPFPNFNLGSVEVLKGNYRKAVSYFINAIQNTTNNAECFVVHSEMYLGKEYDDTNSVAFESFSKRVYVYRLQYFAYLNILYCYLRDEDLRKITENIGIIFSQMRSFKEFDMFTHYHYACWRASNNDVDGALDSIEKALQAGFGSYYQLTNDRDLRLLQSNPRFQELCKKYFPPALR